MMNIKPHAVLFDWDNTLVDTWPLIHKALHATFVEMGHTPWTLDEVKQKVAKSARDAFPALFGEAVEDATNRYRNHYRQMHLDALAPLEGAETVLKALQAKHIPIALVSNKMGDTLRMEVSHLGWDGYFGTAIGANDAEYDKPHAAPVLMALGNIEVPATENVWFIGDTEVDLQASKAAGVQSHLYGEHPAHLFEGQYYRGEPFHQHYLNHRALVDMITQLA